MMRPSSEKPDADWNNHAHGGEDAGERVFDDQLIDESERGDARASSSTSSIVPLIWGAAAFAGVVVVGLVIRSRRRRPRWPALLQVTIGPAHAPARGAMLSTIGGAVARLALQRLMAAQRETLASIEQELDQGGWRNETGRTTRSSAHADNGHRS